MEENLLCSKCRKPLLTGEEAARSLCSACAAEQVWPAIRPACGYHPETEAVGVCTRCATFICDACRITRTDPATGQNEPYCRDCYGKVEEASYYCAWEDKSIFFYRRFWMTWKEIIVHPFDFFDKLPRIPDKTSALTFAYLSSAHTLVLGIMLFPLYPMASLPILMTGVLGLIAGVTVLLVAVPIILFLSAASVHLGIRMQFEKRDFDQTFRIVGYGSATHVLGAVPIINLVAAIINQVITFSGLKRLHKLSTGQAILAMVLFPFIIGIAAVILIGIIGVKMGIW
ncbi:MAG: Yip1 family protein [bacterium]